ncbi:hypothetical protein [Paracoccus luteus]|nr:hypothetical protein [Paracoccus luteus]
MRADDRSSLLIGIRSAPQLTRHAVFRERCDLIRAHADTPLPRQRL